MSSFDTQIHSDELIPNCPFCDEVLDGATEGGMHSSCYSEFGAEMERFEVRRFALPSIPVLRPLLLVRRFLGGSGGV